MGQGPSTPETTKSHSSITQISKIFKILSFGSNIKKHDLTYTNINNSKILQFIQCNYYTPKQFSDIDNNLLPKFMCKIRKTVDLGDTRIHSLDEKKKIFERLKFDKDVVDDELDEDQLIDGFNMYQYSLNETQLKRLEEIIQQELARLGKYIPGPVYVSYAKKKEYVGNYLSRVCRKVGSDGDYNKRKFYNELLSKLDSDHNSVKKTIFARYVWTGKVDLIILIPNMNNCNRVHTNMFDYTVHNQLIENLINNKFMNDIVKLDPNDGKMSGKLYSFFIKQQNFKHDSNNLCYLHGCSSDTNENLSQLLPTYDSEDATLRMNAKDKKIYLPQKCLQPFDYVNNGYNPTGNDVRDNFGFFKNVDYTDIIFEMIFTKAFLCFHENADKEGGGIARRWNDYKSTDPNNLTPKTNISYDIIMYTNSYVNQCIKGTAAAKEEEGEEAPELAIEPIKIEKDHYSEWNHDIMIELAKRNRKFPGIQEYIYPFFRLDIDKTNIRNKFYYMPWGNRLLTNKESLCDDQSLSEIKSHNNVYSIFVDNYGRFGKKRYNSIIQWYSTYNFGYGTYKIQLKSNGLIDIIKKNNTNYSTVLSIKSLNGKFKNPLSLLVSNNNGDFIIYENGMKPIKKLNKIELSNKIVKDDIEDINKYGLWSYMTTDKNDPNAVRERNYNYNRINNKSNNKLNDNLKCTNIRMDLVENFNNNELIRFKKLLDKFKSKNFK